MQDTKTMVNRINKALEKLIARGMEIRNEIVITKNNYLVAKNKVESFEHELNKKLNDALYTHNVNMMNYTKSKIYSIASIFSLIAGIAVGFSLNPVLGAFISVGSAFSIVYNTIKATKLKRTVNKYKMLIGKLQDMDSNIKQSSFDLENSLKSYIDVLESELLETNRQFDTLKKAKEDLLSLLTTSHDSNHFVDSKDELSFDLPLTF